MVKCVCGKSVEKVPFWLSSVKVEFVCTNCPRRQVKTIAQLSAEQESLNKNEGELKALDSLDEEEEELS